MVSPHYSGFNPKGDVVKLCHCGTENVLLPSPQSTKEFYAIVKEHLPLAAQELGFEWDRASATGLMDTVTC